MCVPVPHNDCDAISAVYNKYNHSVNKNDGFILLGCSWQKDLTKSVILSLVARVLQRSFFYFYEGQSTKSSISHGGSVSCFDQFELADAPFTFT